MFSLIVWLIIGTVILIDGKINRFYYATCWLALLIELTKNII